MVVGLWVAGSVASSVGAAPAKRLALSPRTVVTTPAFIAPPDTDRAEALFAEGEAAYEAGDFATAADRFAAAQDIAPHPATLYNLGMAQHRSGEVLAAHATFTALESIANTPDERAEAIAARRRVRRELSKVVVMVRPDVTVCLDQDALPADPDGDRRGRLILPGSHTLRAYGKRTEIELEPGETQTLWLDGWAADLPRRRPPLGPASTGLLAGSIAAAAVALGTGAVAATSNDELTSQRMAITAAAAGGVALTTTTAAVILIVLRARQPEATAPPRKASDCSQP